MACKRLPTGSFAFSFDKVPGPATLCPARPGSAKLENPQASLAARRVGGEGAPYSEPETGPESGSTGGEDR